MNNRKRNNAGVYPSSSLSRKHDVIENLSSRYNFVFEELKDFIKTKMANEDLTIKKFSKLSGVSETIIREFLALNPIKTKVKNFVLMLDALGVKTYEIELSKSGQELILGVTDLDVFLKEKETGRLLKRRSCFNSFYWLKNIIIPSNFGNAPIDSLIMLSHFINMKKVTLDIDLLKRFYSDSGFYERKR